MLIKDFAVLRAIDESYNFNEVESYCIENGQEIMWVALTTEGCTLGNPSVHGYAIYTQEYGVSSTPSELMFLDSIFDAVDYYKGLLKDQGVEVV